MLIKGFRHVMPQRGGIKEGAPYKKTTSKRGGGGLLEWRGVIERGLNRAFMVLQY